MITLELTPAQLNTIDDAVDFRIYDLRENYEYNQAVQDFIDEVMAVLRIIREAQPEDTENLKNETQVSLRISPTLHTMLKCAAKQDNRSITSLLIHLLSEHLQDEDTGNPLGLVPAA